MSVTNTDSSRLIHEPINDEYEWIQYNNQLRIIHSIDDDMYQMKSIIEACGSNKLPADWFRNQSITEILDEIATMGIPIVAKFYENRTNLIPGLRGYYIHRLLVNAVAMWASPRYAVHIFMLLDKIAAEERDELVKMVEAKETKIAEQLPRMVPASKAASYRYFIWKEPSSTDSSKVILHLVKRHKSNFRQMSKHYHNEDEKWFYREVLPNSMSINECIKPLIQQNFPGSEYTMKGSVVTIGKQHLPRLYDIIARYFDEFQK